MVTQTSNGIPRKFQLISIACTVAIIIFLINRFNAKFCSIDNKPEIHQLAESDIKNSKKPNLVRVGLSINDFSEFNILNNKFVCTGLIWFQFDPKLVSLKTIEKFAFEKGDIEKKSDAYTSNIDGLILARYTIRLSFKSDLLYYFFPFDDHKIFITLINESATPSEFMLTSSKSDFIVSDNSKNEGWHPHNLNVKTGFGITKIGSNKNPIFHPRAIFQMDYVQDSIRFIIMIILPLLLIFLIDLFSLCLDQKEQRSTIVQMSGTNIAALFAYRFVIESITPKVGYFMLSDYLFFLFLSISFATLLIHGFGPYMSVNQKKIFSITLQLCVILVFAYFLRINEFCS